MLGNLWTMFLVMLCLGLTLPGCSVEPGGGEDPPGFSSKLTPAEKDAPAQVEAAPVMTEPGKLEALEGKLQSALERVSALEHSVQSLKDSVAAVEVTASQALLKAQEGPLARVDLSNETAAGKALLENSLEQIIDISRQLLDKMENELDKSAQSPAPQPAAPGAAGNKAVEVQ